MQAYQLYHSFNDKSRELFTDARVSFHEQGRHSLDAFLEMPLRPHQFVTMGNMLTGELELAYSRDVKKVIGVEEQEFTSLKLYEMCWPPHLPLAMVFAIIAKQLVKEAPVSFSAEHGYSVEFAIQLPDGTFKRLERFCWMYECPDDQPFLFLDIWTDVTQQKEVFAPLSCSIYTPDEASGKQLNARFHEIWTQDFLGFSLSDRELETLWYLQDSSLNRDQVADFMGIKLQTVPYYLKRASKKVNDFIDTTREAIQHQNTARSEEAFLRNSIQQMIAAEDNVQSLPQLQAFVEKYRLQTRQNTLMRRKK
ncbi:MAG: hypothetical protein R2795_24490 [Saprospiraceae bacterium]